MVRARWGGDAGGGRMVSALDNGDDGDAEVRGRAPHGGCCAPSAPLAGSAAPGAPSFKADCAASPAASAAWEKGTDIIDVWKT